MQLNPWVVDFLLWLRAVELQWIGIISGALFGVLFFVVERLMKRPFSYGSIIVASVAAFVLANFLAWHEQESRADNTTAVLIQAETASAQAQQRPNLQASIQDAWTYTQGKTSGVILVVDIRNVGTTPSVADYWAIYANLLKGPGGKITLMSVEPSYAFALRVAGGGSMRFKPQYWLPDRTVAAPIALGGDVKGILIGQLPRGVSAKDVDYKSISLTFNDVAGQTHSSMVVPFYIDPPMVPIPTLDQP
jgi:hypothetical protein